MGFIEGKMTSNQGPLKKGDKVWVEADDYTSGGGNDDVNILHDDEKTKDKVKKKFLKIS